MPNLTSAYIVDLDNPQDKLEFQFMPPEIEEDKIADWEHFTIIGRSEPVQGWGSSGPRTFNLTLRFIAGDLTPEEVKQKVDFCRSLVYPDYAANLTPPPDLLLIVGKLFSSQVICKSYRTKYMSPWDTITLLPYQAEVTFTFEEVNQFPFGKKEVRSGRDISRQPVIQKDEPIKNVDFAISTENLA